jgi:hypothetical protein
MSSSTRWSHAEPGAVARPLAARPTAAEPGFRLLATLLLAAACLTTAAFAHASVAASAPAHVLRHIDDARATPSGRLTWFGLHVYDARMFVPRAFDAANPSAQPFALEITYARSLDGRAIAERSRDEIARLGLGTAAQQQRWLGDMAGLFPDVKAGQSLVGIYRPGGGTRFYLDGRAIGEVSDPEFGKAFFAIWLDPRTSAPQLRASLLSAARN